MKVQWTLVVGLIFAIIVAVFAMVNVESVPVNYVFGEARWPLILVILGSVLIGFIISFCFSAFRMLGSKRQTKAVRKELEDTRVLLNEKDAEILRLKDELRERGASAFVIEEIPDDNETKKGTKK
ncbi:LapA family protein [Solibacillus silvestris]|uniref:LapA family protein n=1 Tax=Solibacillus silvestris TaxID=76853 RepID=UPI003F7F9010